MLRAQKEVRTTDFREHPTFHNQTVSKDTYIKTLLVRGQEQTTEICYRKSDEWCSHYRVAVCLAELCPGVRWKEEFVTNETGYLAEEISKQSVQGVHKESPGPDLLGEFYQTFKEELIQIFHKLLKTYKKRYSFKIIIETSITLMVKSDKYIIGKESYT